MNIFATTDFQFDDFEIHLLKEKDILSVINLFRLNYGTDYVFPHLYDDTFYKKAIYGEDIIWLVLRNREVVIASGAIDIGAGSNNDQIGMLFGLVVHPDYKKLGLAQRIIKALVIAAGENVEYADTNARTAHPASQLLMERSEFKPVGIYPQQYLLGKSRESMIIYGKLYGNAHELRSKTAPVLITDVANIARRVLPSMNLPDNIHEISECNAYPYDDSYSLRPLENRFLVELTAIKREAKSFPPVFGNVTIDYGRSAIRRRHIDYLVAFDDFNRITGAIGYKSDLENRSIKLIELIAENELVIGSLCREFWKMTETGNIDVAEVNVAAYDERLQRTFFDYGFRPTAYSPAFVYHNGERLDVVKMIKLNVEFSARELQLTDAAQTIAGIISNNFQYQN